MDPPPCPAGCAAYTQVVGCSRCRCALQAPPPPRLQGPAFTQAAVESGVLLLLQRPRAVSPADCPGKQLAVAEVAGVGGWHRSRK